jgi:protein O-GlcNAc transferase
MNISKILQQAIKFQQTELFEEAEKLYRKILKVEPKHPKTNHNLAILMLCKSQFGAASKLFKIALKSEINAEQMWRDFFNENIHSKQLSVIEKLLAQGKSCGLPKKEYDQLHTLLKNELDNCKPVFNTNEINNLIIFLSPTRQNNVKEGISDFCLKYSNESQFNNLSAMYFSEHGKSTEAVKCYQRVLEINPECASVYNNLGLAFHKLRQFDAAIQSFKKAFSLLPSYAEAYYNLGITLNAMGELNAAVRSYQIALKLKPNYFNAHLNLGNTHSELGQLEKAKKNYKCAIKLQPNNEEAFNNLGVTYKELGELDAAIRNYKKSITINSAYELSYYNIANIYKDTGKLTEAINNYEKALSIKPDYIEAHNNRLFTFNYLTNYDADFNLKEAVKFGRLLKKKVTSHFSIFQASTQPSRLKIGLVSGDFRNHPVGHFLEHVIVALAEQNLELIAYSTYPQLDDLSARIKPYFSEWKVLYGLTDEKSANLIYDDGIHILVDLSGHTGHNRLPVFAFKPAPVQISWLGYFATTGLAEMDYILGDPYVTPLEYQNFFTEKIWQLPETRWCFTPPDYNIDCGILPATQNNYITFGCFNNYTKLNETVVALWARILNSVSNSRLFLKASQFGDQKVKEEVIQRFLNYGIDARRIKVEGFDLREIFFSSYQQIDIALDPFPFSGGTTTVEALWMGVPVLTLQGKSLVSRQGVGVLMNVGLSHWIANDQDEYLTKAISFTTDLDKLAALRLGLRKQVLASPLFDAVRFSKNFEKALWSMWRKWLKDRNNIT